MIVIDGAAALPPAWRRAHLALGNFDGAHLGHQAVIDRARAMGRRFGVVTFEPPPRRFFQPEAPPFRLTSPIARARLIADLGADLLIELPFDAALAGMSAAAFVERVLVERFGAASIAIGFDFCFGKNRSGDAASLRDLGAHWGFDVEIAPQIMAEGDKISSSRIRAAIEAGDMAQATQWLGRPWLIAGEVEAGERRGRTIGFPTANFRLGDVIAPRQGVYALRVDIGDGRWRGGVGNFGRTPTTGARAPLFEAHVFDFTGDLYGRTLLVELVAFLRPEQRFAGLEALLAQIQEDAARAKEMLRLLPAGAP